MEFLASFITSLSTAIAMLAVIWLWRKTKKANSVEFAMAIGAVAYTIYHYFACGIGGIYLNPLHEIITGLFIGVVVVVNAWCGTRKLSEVNIGVDRRRQDNIVNFKDRRKEDSHVLFRRVAGNNDETIHL